MLRVIPPGLALLYRYYPLTWRILWLTFYYVVVVVFIFILILKNVIFSIVNSFVRNISFYLLLSSRSTIWPNMSNRNFNIILIFLKYVSYLSNYTNIMRILFSKKSEFQSNSVCNFQSMKSPVELNSLFSEFFCYITWFVISPGLLYHLIWRDTGQLANESFTSNSIVSSKQ